MSDVMNTMAPIVSRVRAYFAPVTQPVSQTTGFTIFDPAQEGAFALDSPPAPWIDLGWIAGFTRKCGTKIEAIRTGAPAATQMQVRTEIDATVSFSFESWRKLQLAISAGTQQMNLLKTAASVPADGSGGTAVPAAPLISSSGTTGGNAPVVGLPVTPIVPPVTTSGGSPVSTSTVLQVGATAAAMFSVGELIAVDVDYTGQTGFIGSGVSGAYVQTALTDVDYVRRVTLNVGRIASIANGALTLEWPLLAGVPTNDMSVSGVVGFCDREGSTFFQEWSALFVAEGQQGERIIWHYPRLQAMSGIAETESASSGGYETMRLSAAFRALPVQDPVDGQTVVCFRSYVAG